MPPRPETRTIRHAAERTPTPDDSDPIFHMAPLNDAAAATDRARQPMRRGTRRTANDTELPHETVVDNAQD